jgi:LCP family protein required for cell wall assembly
MVLITGVASKDYLYGLSDAIRVARIDFQTQEVTVLAVPRDLWVEIPGLESRGITVGKLNQAYFYGTEGMGYYSGGGYGSGLLAETLYQNYGLVIDRYISVNLNSFREIINAMGGLDIYLPQDVYKRVNDQPVLFLESGSHHLNGKEVELLARQRINIGDFGRINNQTIILKAIAAQLLTPTGISAIPVIIDEVQSNVLTDLSPAEISQLVCLAGMLDFQDDIHFTSIPQELIAEYMVYDPVRAIDTAALVGDEELIRDVLNDFQLGVWP